MCWRSITLRRGDRDPFNVRQPTFKDLLLNPLHSTFTSDLPVSAQLRGHSFKFLHRLLEANPDCRQKLATASSVPAVLALLDVLLDRYSLPRDLAHATFHARSGSGVGGGMVSGGLALGGGLDPALAAGLREGLEYLRAAPADPHWQAHFAAKGCALGSTSWYRRHW